MQTEVIIIGAGPIGLEAAAVLKRSGIDYLHFDAGQIGETFLKWPRQTIFYSSPEWIAIAGVPIQTPEQFRITGEQYLAYLRQVTEILDLRVRTYERVTGISGTRGDFTVSTERRGESASYQCSYIILATGGLDTPRYLGIPGEDAAHVSHYFDDPHRYFRQKLLIVGGRNSAVEAAVRSWRAGARVGLSYRRAEIEEAHVLSRLHLEVSLLIKKGQIDFYPSTEPVKIGTRSVTLRHTAGSPEPGSSMQVAADFVYLATGFRQNPALFREAGVTLEGSEMRPRFDPRSMETDVPGIYLAGTAAGGSQREFSEFITTGHVHSRRILQHLTGGSGAVTGNLPERDYPLSPDDIH